MHTSLNHKVEANSGGDWNEADYTIISPFQSMVEANGVPTMLNTVDTWWARNPGESLIWPEVVIVEPGGDTVQGLFTTEGKIIKFRSEGLDSSQLSQLVAALRETDSMVGLRLNTERAFLDSFQIITLLNDRTLERDWNTSSASLALHKLVYQTQNPQAPELLSRLTEIKEGQPRLNLENRVREMIQSSPVVESLKPEVQNRDAAIDHLVGGIVDKIKSAMRSQINRLAVTETIKSRGFQVHGGGDYGWGDENSEDVEVRTKALASQLGTEYGVHTYTVQATIENKIKEATGIALDEDNPAQFNWPKYEPLFEEYMGDIDPSTRRVLYLTFPN